MTNNSRYIQATDPNLSENSALEEAMIDVFNTLGGDYDIYFKASRSKSSKDTLPTIVYVKKHANSTVETKIKYQY